MSYSIDIYRREMKSEKNFIKFAVFVSFFPQLVAGPIVRAKEFLPQLRKNQHISQPEFNASLYLIFQGLFKKIVFADLLAKLAVDQVFLAPQDYSSSDLLLALYGYAFQIYNDFSGYSDIAIGTAGLFGFYLPENFRQPYLSTSIREFWSRWHISLSTWIRDYLYFPLGGNRGSELRTLFNLLLTMILAGLWHGASLNFMYWGAYHGTLLATAFVLRNRFNFKFPKLVSRFVTFHLVVFGWLLFRISDMPSLLIYGKGMLACTTILNVPTFYIALLIAALLGHCVPVKFNDQAKNVVSKMPSAVLGLIMSALIIFFCACTLDSPAFIYFQF